MTTTAITGVVELFSGITVDPSNGTIWVTTDQLGMGGAIVTKKRVWNFTSDGVLLSSFTNVYDTSANECEDIVVDPITGKLWIVDDSTQYCYYCNRDGTLISSFNIAPLGITSVQGIELDYTDQTLWFICNNTRKIYHCTKAGVAIGTPIDISGISPQPTSWQGVAIDRSTDTFYICGYGPNGTFRLSKTGTVLEAYTDAGITGSTNQVTLAWDSRFMPQK